MYRIHMFDGLILPEYLPSGGSNDIGSGDALTSFNQLPGGGFFDNYGERISPQNIRPITRNCVIWGDTAAELYSRFNAVRGKIGKRGKLSVRFDNGEIWWQWARLQRVHNPRPIDAKANWLPCGLTFVTASQQWYGLIETAEGWEVGDESFYLGDGTAAVGQESHTFDLDFPTENDMAAVLTNDGSTHVRNLRIEMALDENITTATILNQTTGSRLEWANPGITGSWTLQIDTGEKSCRVRHDSPGVGISTIINRGARVYVNALAAHGLTSGDSIEVAGTETFDGVYHNVVRTSTTQFYFEKLAETEMDFAELTGEIYTLDDSWVNLTVYDRTNWFLLATGDNFVNVITLTDGVGAQLQDYTVSFAYYHHFK